MSGIPLAVHEITGHFWAAYDLHGKKSSTCCNVVKNKIEQCCAAHIVQGC